MYGHICRMGIIEAEQWNLTEALQYYDQSLAVKTACLPPPCDDISTAASMADTVVNIGLVYCRQELYTLSIEQSQCALELYRVAYYSTCREYRFAMANTYLALACAYAGLSSQNSENCEEALVNAMKCLGSAQEHGLIYIPHVSEFLKSEKTLEVLRKHQNYQSTLKELINNSLEIHNLP